MKRGILILLTGYAKSKDSVSSFISILKGLSDLNQKMLSLVLVPGVGRASKRTAEMGSHSWIPWCFLDAIEWSVWLLRVYLRGNRIMYVFVLLYFCASCYFISITSLLFCTDL